MPPRTRVDADSADPMALDVAPFDQATIPFNRPVVGRDLEFLRTHLGLNVRDASWLFGLQVTPWYQHTVDPVLKLENKAARERSRLQQEIADLQRNIEALESTAGSDSKKRAQLDKLVANKAKIERKLEATTITREQRRKAEAERDASTDGPDKPVDSSLALLVRFIDTHQDYIENVRLRQPTVADLRERLPEMSDRVLGEILGRDASATHRWLTLGAEPHPTVRRLVDALSQWLDNQSTKAQSTSAVGTWLNVVRREWALHAGGANLEQAPDRSKASRGLNQTPSRRATNK